MMPPDGAPERTGALSSVSHPGREIAMADVGSQAIAGGRRARLWAEFAGLYVAIPLAMAFALPSDTLWWGLAGLFALAVLLLSLADGFSWRSLIAAPAVPDWPALAGFVALAAAISVGLVLWLRPYALFGMPLHNRELWLAIMALYPLLSAFPQEVVFRVLFFRRYGALFNGSHLAIAANAAAFSLAHLFYWNWPAIVLTALGGAVFAWAYREKGSFLFAWLLHAVAGQIVFTSGLGRYFYHGAI